MKVVIICIARSFLPAPPLQSGPPAWETGAFPVMFIRHSGAGSVTQGVTSASLAAAAGVAGTDSVADDVGPP